MGFWDWLATVITALAWPLTILYGIHLLKGELVGFLRRITSLKAGGFEIMTSAQNELLMNVQTSTTKLKTKGILREFENANGKFLHYKNGQIVQKITISVPANQDKLNIRFPSPFPFEVTSITPVGNAYLQIVKITTTECDLRVEPEHELREITLIISGL